MEREKKLAYYKAILKTLEYTKEYQNESLVELVKEIERDNTPPFEVNITKVKKKVKNV